MQLDGYTGYSPLTRPSRSHQAAPDRTAPFRLRLFAGWNGCQKPRIPALRAMSWNSRTRTDRSRMVMTAMAATCDMLPLRLKSNMKTGTVRVLVDDRSSAAGNSLKDQITT